MTWRGDSRGPVSSAQRASTTSPRSSCNAAGSRRSRSRTRLAPISSRCTPTPARSSRSSRRRGRGGDHWVLGIKDETPSDRTDSWYILVALRGQTERPDFYVIPRNHVAAYLYVGHRNFLRKPGRGGRPHQDGPRRTMFALDIQAYKEDWGALLKPTSERPYALPDWVAKYAPVLGLPPGGPRERVSSRADGRLRRLEPAASGSTVRWGS